MHAKFSTGLIELNAREGEPKDIALMEQVVSLLKEEGYSDIYGDGDYHVTMGSDFRAPIREMRVDYAQAKIKAVGDRDKRQRVLAGERVVMSDEQLDRWEADSMPTHVVSLPNPDRVGILDRWLVFAKL